jgi:hypothetical protein
VRATFQWFDTPGYHGNTITRISGKPKGYLADTGLACSLQKISTASTLSGHPLTEALFETALSRSGTICLNMVELWPVIGMVETICYRTGIHCNNCNENIPDQAFYGNSYCIYSRSVVLYCK